MEVSRPTTSTVLLTSSPPIPTSPTPSTSSFVPVLSSYWYVFLVLLVVVAVATLFLCTCIVRKKRRQGQQTMAATQIHLQSISPASVRQTPTQHTNDSALDLGGISGTPGSLSTGHTPIPSPQPSFSSSHRSLQSGSRYSSGLAGGHKKRRRHHSPGHTSSGSEDTIKGFPGHSSSSLASSAATLEPHCSRLHRAESTSSGHTHHSGCGPQSAGHRRSTSNPNVKITALAQDSPLHSAPSMQSIISGHSHRSTPPGLAMVGIPGLVQVDVKVHLEQSQGAAPCQIAAALAESARQLAQSAANFEQEEDVQSMLSRSSLSSPRPSRSVISSSQSSRQSSSRRQLFPNHSSGRLRDYAPSSLSLDRSVHPVGHLGSLDRTRHPGSFDRLGHPGSSNRSGYPMSLDRQGYPVSLDRTGHLVSSRHQMSLDRPGHPLSLDRSGYPVRSGYPMRQGYLISSDRPEHPGSLDRQGNLATSLDRPRHPVSFLDMQEDPVSLDRQRHPGSWDRQERSVSSGSQGYQVSLDKKGHQVSLDKPGHSVRLNRTGHPMSLDRQELPFNLGRPGQVVTDNIEHTVRLDGPRHLITLDRPGYYLNRPAHAGSLDRADYHAVSLDGPGYLNKLENVVSLDAPGHPNHGSGHPRHPNHGSGHPRHPGSWDRLGHIASLDNPRLFCRNISASKQSSFSDLPPSISRSHSSDYGSLPSSSSGQHGHIEDDAVVLPDHINHSYHSPNNSRKSAQQQRNKCLGQLEQEGVSGTSLDGTSLDVPPPQPLHTRQFQHYNSALALGGTHKPEDPVPVEHGTESGIKSEIITIKAPSHSRAAHNRGQSQDGELQVSVSPLPQCMHIREDSSSSQMQESALVSPPDSQGSSSFLSRSGSGLSLEPALGSTVSGYAATGSSSSTETISKSMQSSELPTEIPRLAHDTLTQSLDTVHVQSLTNHTIGASGYLRDERSNVTDLAGHVIRTQDKSARNKLRTVDAYPLYPAEQEVLQEDKGLMLSPPTSWMHHHHQGQSTWSDRRRDLGMVVASPTWTMQASRLDYAVHGPGENVEDHHSTIPNDSSTIAIDI